MTDLKISRRDFINGFALSVAAGSALSPLELMAMTGDTGRAYPPARTGMRGNHPGSFEIAHAVGRAGATWPRPERQTDATYDLVVVGGGISGLTAACLYRNSIGKDARILILDNHDDFGGHAKRNEFTVDGQKLIGYGGSQSIESPALYSAAAMQVLQGIGIETDRFYEYFDRNYFDEHKLRRGIYFSKARYGEDRVLPNFMPGFGGGPVEMAAVVRTYPLPVQSKQALLALLADEHDLLPGHSRADKIDLMRRTSYSDFLRKYAGQPDDVVGLFRDAIKGLWGVGWDALSALEGYRLRMPGTAHLGIGDLEHAPLAHDEPYIFHFPDGNAGVARALVRELIPHAVPGHTMADLVAARVDYGLLDTEKSAIRIRLQSTGVDVRHTRDGKAVDVTYVAHGEARRVRGRHTILACYNNLIPHICSEMPAPQVEAIGYAAKVPLVYINVAVRNWRAFAELGYHSVYVPNADLMHTFGLDFPVSIGRYQYTDSPDDPAVIHGNFVPTAPDQGLSAREQHIAGRRRLYEMSFDEFERSIVGQMSGALGAGGFDAARDISAITVNRWPHGYAYEYNDYSDPADWNRHNGPHVAGRAQIGRISIANSDAAAYAYVDGAIDAAVRAVDEQLTLER